MNGSSNGDDLTDSDVTYLGGLSKDVLFMEFIGNIGLKVAVWLVGSNLGIPRFNTAKDVLKLQPSRYTQPHHYEFGQMALRMMNPAASFDCNAVAREAISECVMGWIASHAYEMVPVRN